MQDFSDQQLQCSNWLCSNLLLSHHQAQQFSRLIPLAHPSLADWICLSLILSFLELVHLFEDWWPTIGNQEYSCKSKLKGYSIMHLRDIKTSKHLFMWNMMTLSLQFIVQKVISPHPIQNGLLCLRCLLGRTILLLFFAALSIHSGQVRYWRSERHNCKPYKSLT